MSMPPLSSCDEWDNEHPMSQSEYEAAMLEAQRRDYESMTLEDYVGPVEFARLKAEYEAAQAKAAGGE